MKTSKIVQVSGFSFVMENGDKVSSNLNYSSKIGDVINYAEIRSLKNVKMQAGATQWTESKAIGHKFYKQF